MSHHIARMLVLKPSFNKATFVASPPFATDTFRSSFKAHRCRRCCASTSQKEDTQVLQGVLTKIEQYLSNGTVEDEASALKLIRSLEDSGYIQGFDKGRSIPKQVYSLADLRLHKIDASKLLTPEDTTLSRLRTYIALSYFGVVSIAVLADLINISSATGIAILTALLIGIDQIRTGGGLEFLFVEWVASIFLPAYRQRVAIHEAGHFLVAYLLGLLPKNYTLSALDYFKKYRQFSIQAGTTFCDSEFQQEIQDGRLKSSSLDRYTCVALAGVVAEYLYYDHAEGGLNDILQLDVLMRSLKFSQKKVDSELRWAVLNTFTLLKRHRHLHQQLAEYMSEDRSIVDCIRLIEDGVRVLDEI